MAIRIECDGGCGATCEREAEFTEFGHFKKKWYCVNCAESMRKLNIERDCLHDKVSNEWRAGLANLRLGWWNSHKGGTLPDE